MSVIALSNPLDWQRHLTSKVKLNDVSKLSSSLSMNEIHVFIVIGKHIKISDKNKAEEKKKFHSNFICLRNE